MKKSDIDISDWQRILIGEVPAGFYLELFCRTVFVFVLLLVAMRFLGKRMSSQLNRNELAALVALAAAIGVPLLSPERGLIPGLIIAVVIVIISRFIAIMAYRHPKFEAISQGDISILVENGVLQLASMQHANLSRERIFAEIRSNGLKHLGQVKRLYLEADGSFSIVKSHQNPGLSIIPSIDSELSNKQKKSDTMVCKKCGAVCQPEKKCTNCKNASLVAAIYS